jgi:hypothetical protein
LNGGAVLELFEDVARLSHSWKTPEARAAGADTPGGQRYGKALRLPGDLFDRDSSPRELHAEMVKVVLRRGLRRSVFILNLIVADAIGFADCRSPGKAAGCAARLFAVFPETRSTVDHATDPSPWRR